MKNKLYWLFLIILFSLKFSTSLGQSEIAAKIGYEIPRGELKWIYKPAISYSVSYARIKAGDNSQASAGVRLGFFQFKPKEDIFYYLYGKDDYGTISYSKYTVLQLVIPFRMDFYIGKSLELSLGLDGGYNYVRYEYESRNPHAVTLEETIDGKGAVAPGLGFNYKLTEAVGISVSSKYNVIFSLGSTDSNTGNFNANVGLFNTFITNNLGVFVRF